MRQTPDHKIELSLPVKISYNTIGAYLQQKLAGQVISREEKGRERTYAEIQDITLAESGVEGFDLRVDLGIKTLTSLFRNRTARLLLDVAIDFDREQQAVSVKDFRMNVESRSWLVDNALEAIVHSFMYDKLRNRMRFDFKELIQEKLSDLNKKLEEPQEAAEGIFFSGFVEDFRVKELLPGEQMLLVMLGVQARALAEIREIRF